MIRSLVFAALAASLAGPALAQSANQTVLPSDPALRAIACAAVLDATAMSMRPASGASAMADELAAFAGKWKVQARSLGAGAGRAEADTDKLVTEQTSRLYQAGKGLPPGTFVAAQTCQAEGEPLPAA
jgi:opacity protein-like surface antigen